MGPHKIKGNGRFLQSRYSLSAGRFSMSTNITLALDQHARAKRARTEATDALHADIEQLHSVDQASLASSSKRSQTYTSHSLSWVYHTFSCFNHLAHIFF